MLGLPEKSPQQAQAYPPHPIAAPSRPARAASKAYTMQSLRWLHPFAALGKWPSQARWKTSAAGPGRLGRCRSFREKPRSDGRIRTTRCSPDAPRREIKAPARLPCFLLLGENGECARDEIAGIGHQEGSARRRLLHRGISQTRSVLEC